MDRAEDMSRTIARSRLLVAAVVVAGGLLLHGGASAQPDRELKEARSLSSRAVELSNQGQYDAAIPIAERSLQISEKAQGPEHPDVAVSLNNLAEIYRMKGDYARAEPLYERALRALEKALGPEHLRVAVSLNNLAVLYDSKGEYLRAEPLYERSLRIVERVLGPEHPTVATNLNNLAVFYKARGEYARAEPLYERSLRIREKVLGLEHPDVAVSLSNLAELYRTKGEYARAEPLYKRALRILEKVLGSEHLRVAISLNNLAVLYDSKGEYTQAEPLHERSLRIVEKVLGPEHPTVATSLNNLAAFYKARGDYTRAEPLCERALRIREKVLAPEHPDVAVSLNNLAEIHRTNGDYARAEPLYERALRILEKVLGVEHPDVATNLNNLAGLYEAEGDFSRVEPLYERILRIREKALGEEHPDVAVSLNNLAKLYQMKGDYARAQPLYERALRILERALGLEHPSVATSLNNLAVLHMAKGDYARAEPLYERSLRIREKVLGSEHADVASSLNNLAELYRMEGAYARALPLHERTVRMLKRVLGPEHPDVATSLKNLALLYMAKGDYAQAVATEYRADDVREVNLTAILATGAEEQKQAYFATVSGETDATVSLHTSLAPKMPEAARLALTTILRRKGRVLEAMRDLFRVLRKHADPKDMARIEELARVRAELATGILRGPTKGEDPQVHMRGMSQLQEKGRELEKALASRYAAFDVKQNPVTLDAVQAALPPGSALAEYFVFKPFDARAKPGAQWGKPRYVAYVLRSSGDLGWADLGEAETIDGLARAVRSNYAAGAPPGTAHSARDLYRLVMQPVRKLLGDTTDVFLAPDGELNLVPFGALPDEDGEYLVKRYRFTYLSSGRDLPRLGLASNPSEGPAIMAAPDYGDAGQAPAESSDGSVGGLRSVDMNSVRFSPLPGTLVEAKRLARTLTGARVLTGRAATEGALKAMRGPRILHLATHGFFLANLPSRAPVGQDHGIASIAHLDGPHTGAVAPAMVALAPPMRGGGRLENPLLRSGLALAGANRRASGEDDGILTAMEALSLDLIGTQLVVLSACETGMGDVRNGDGVYGLRRALVLAGAETQVTTLWRIDDDVTQALMAEYYDKITKGVGRSEAMREVTLKLLANPRTSNPKYWASFIVSGDPRPLHRSRPSAAVGGQLQ